MIETKITFNRGFIDDKTRGMQRAVGDMRKAWPKVADEFDRIVESIFHNEGGASGQWEPLSDKYADRKSPDHGLLRRSDALFTSLTRKYARHAIFRVRKDGFTRGSSLKYFQFHQNGTRNMPARPIYDFRENHVRRMRDVLRQELRASMVSLGIEVS